MNITGAIPFLVNLFGGEPEIIADLIDDTIKGADLSADAATQQTQISALVAARVTMSPAEVSALCAKFGITAAATVTQAETLCAAWGEATGALAAFLVEEGGTAALAKAEA